MARPSTLQKLAEQRYKEEGDLSQLKRHLWNAVNRASDLVDSENTDTARRGIHSLGQVAAQYIKTHELTELLDRVTVLEEKLTT